MQPGQTITPDGEIKTEAQSVAPKLPPAQPETPPVSNQTDDRQDWSTQPVPQAPQDSIDFDQEASEVQWSASEYIHNQKNPLWYMGLGLVSGLIALILFLVTQDMVSVVIVVIATLLLGVSGAKKPSTLNYKITSTGIHIGNKLYRFEDIKSFSLIDDGAISSIHITPLKRFMPALTIYYPPEEEENIFQSLGNHIPHEERRADAVDRLMKRIRF
jgi:hypothetical protein